MKSIKLRFHPNNTRNEAMIWTWSSEQRKNESSTKQVELNHLKEEIKYIKRTLDMLLERQWLETPKDNEEGSTETKNQKINQKQIKKHRNQGRTKHKQQERTRTKTRKR